MLRTEWGNVVTDFNAGEKKDDFFVFVLEIIFFRAIVVKKLIEEHCSVA